MRTNVCSYTLAAALALSAQAAGAIHLPVVAAYASLVVASGFLALPRGFVFAPLRTFFLSRRVSVRADEAEGTKTTSGNLRASVGSGIWFVLALFCLLQALPIPLGWLAAIAPEQADIWSRSLKPMGLPPPDFASVSLAPHRTLIEALKMASYGVVFGVAARLGRQGTTRVVAIVFGSALLVALVTAAHQVVGAERLFGVYEPVDAPMAAPLLNPNSRAGYLNLGFFCGLGLLFRAGNNPRGSLIGVGLIFLVAEILLCQSRGGTGTLVIGVVLVLLLRRSADGASSSSQGELSRLGQAGILALIALLATFMALSARSEGGLGFQESLDKVDVVVRAGRMALDHALFGVGRGAFGSAFSAYQPRAGTMVFEHAENLPVQWAAEWGIPVTLAALAALGWALWPALSRRGLGSPIRRCTLVGCLVLLGQNLADLGLEIPAVAALMACALGVLSVPPPSKGPAAGVNVHLLLGGALLTIVCLGLALAWGSDSPARERERLHGVLATAKGAPSADFWDGLQRAVRSYPADPYFPLLGASAAIAAGQNAIPWVARALERAPSSAQAHLSLARALRARGAIGQAVGALRRAAELDPHEADHAIRLGFEWKLPLNELANAVPAGPAGAPLFRMLAADTEDRAERLRWLAEALARDPGSPETHYLMALELYRDISAKDGPVVCRDGRDECLRRAREHLGHAAEPPSSRVAILEAQLTDVAEGPIAAEARLVKACELLPGDEACARELVKLALRNNSPRLSTAVRALIASGCATPARCAQTHERLGRQFAASGQWHNAASHFRLAALEMPSADNWRALANASRQLGQDLRAEDALRRAELLEAEKKGAQ